MHPSVAEPPNRLNIAKLVVFRYDSPPMKRAITFVDSVTRWVGSIYSVFAHTIAFLFAFLLGVFHAVAWDTILLVLTTVVSLEAIYLAIFIQMSVNENTESLREVEEDVDEIQKDIDAIEHDVDEIQEDEAEEIARDARQQEAIDDISRRLQILLTDIEKLSTKTER